MLRKNWQQTMTEKFPDARCGSVGDNTLVVAKDPGMGPLSWTTIRDAVGTKRGKKPFVLMVPPKDYDELGPAQAGRKTMYFSIVRGYPRFDELAQGLWGLALRYPDLVLSECRRVYGIIIHVEDGSISDHPGLQAEIENVVAACNPPRNGLPEIKIFSDGEVVLIVDADTFPVFRSSLLE